MSALHTSGKQRPEFDMYHYTDPEKISTVGLDRDTIMSLGCTDADIEAVIRLLPGEDVRCSNGLVFRRPGGQ